MISSLDLILDLTAVLNLSRNAILIGQSGILFSALTGYSVMWDLCIPQRKKHLHGRLLPFPPKKVAWSETILSFFFFLLIASLLYPPSIKNLPFCTTSWSICLGTRRDAVCFMNYWIQPIRFSHLLGGILYFNRFDGSSGTEANFQWHLGTAGNTGVVSREHF